MEPRMVGLSEEAKKKIIRQPADKSTLKTLLLLLAKPHNNSHIQCVAVFSSVKFHKLIF